MEYQIWIKRLFDFAFSFLLLILLSPLFLVVIFFQAITMPGPVFFLQERVGKNKHLFSIIKFRTMKVDRAAETALDSSKDDQRLTGFGRLLRRLKIDELPQLVNVLIGEMSLIGPRPTILPQVEKYSEIQVKRLLMRPGMTGLAQVNGNTAISWEERIKYDIKYVENYSLLLDLKIIIKTIAIIILGEEKFVNRK